MTLYWADTTFVIPKNPLYQKRRRTPPTAGAFTQKIGITDFEKRQKIHRQQNPAVDFLIKKLLIISKKP